MNTPVPGLQAYVRRRFEVVLSVGNLKVQRLPIGIIAPTLLLQMLSGFHLRLREHVVVIHKSLRGQISLRSVHRLQLLQVSCGPGPGVYL